MYAKYNSAIVVFEGGTAHVQAVPVPLALKDKCAGGRGSYFRVDLPDGRKMVHLMKDHVPFGIQFGRQVLVSLLNMPERLDWKACTLGEDEDRADAQAFKAAFAPFDPTL
ncbi:CwfJ C-terminus 2-domain-containing protein-like protein [Mycena galericulata]|nr:CwfJ C-terminus 2-domain-containing protein-like protein [Mycena galericulata]